MWDPNQIPNRVKAKNVWERLFKNYTLASHRRSVYHCDPCEPKDSLDFIITSLYDQQEDTFAPKNLVVVHCETCGDGERSQFLRHRVKYVPPERPLLGHPLRVQVAMERRVHPCSLKLACECPHTPLTNNGYSRKPNGGTFTT